MPIKFRCVHCGQFLGISRSKAGTVVDCPTCGRSVGVPEKDGRAERVGNPELNHEDSQLANALREVAAIAAQSSSMAIPQVPSQSSSAEVPNGDGRETREVNALPPQVVSTLPLPPVQPITPNPHPQSATPTAFPRSVGFLGGFSPGHPRAGNSQAAVVFA